MFSYNEKACFLVSPKKQWKIGIWSDSLQGFPRKDGERASKSTSGQVNAAPRVGLKIKMWYISGNIHSQWDLLLMDHLRICGLGICKTLESVLFENNTKWFHQIQHKTQLKESKSEKYCRVTGRHHLCCDPSSYNWCFHTNLDHSQMQQQA